MRRIGALLAVLCSHGGGFRACCGPSLSAEANAAYLADYAKQRGVIVRPSGLMYKIVHNGFGKRPAPTDIVTVYYTGTLINGSVFDGTEEGLPAQFKTSDADSRLDRGARNDARRRRLAHRDSREPRLRRARCRQRRDPSQSGTGVRRHARHGDDAEAKSPRKTKVIRATERSSS